MQQIVECVPNFSEGRRPEIYKTIADEIRAVPGCHVLSVTADEDHNRSVITFVGDGEAVKEGAFHAIRKAAELIDLEQHRGEHPRIGATDVCPFIPVKGISEQECVVLARELGERVGKELGVAVYLYGAAATRPEREKLSDIRRGQYEKWRDEVASHPDRKPDFGPSEPKSWGATVIGVRPFLIAYNLYLNSDRVDLANKIARAVRFSSGGLRYVQAMGFLVENQAQVSMNLTDFSRTPIHTVQEFVKREAARYGLSVTKAELVGMIPEKALLDSAKWYLQLDDFDDQQVLELAIAEKIAEAVTLEGFLDQTAAGTPTPGGGSAAALAGALASALTAMVAGLTVGRKKYVAVEDEMREISRRAVQLQRELTDAIQEDARAYEAVMAAFRDKSAAEDERQAAIQKATVRAGEVPLKVANLSNEMCTLALRAAEIGNSNAVTDAAAACLLGRTAFQIAALNVRINARDLSNRSIAASWERQLRTLDEVTLAAAARVQEITAKRAGI